MRRWRNIESEKEKAGNQGAVRIRYAASCLIGLLFFSLVCAGSQDHKTAFVQGSEAYAQADYNRALAFYSEALKQEGPSVPILYNIGNCYFKLEQKGRALLSYYQAELLSPADKDLRENIFFVEQSIPGRPPVHPAKWFEKLCAKALEHVSFDIIALVFSLMALALGVCLISLVFGYKIRAARWCAAVFAGLMIAVAPVVAGTAWKRYFSNEAVIISSGGSIARYGPTINDTRAFDLPEGSVVRVREVFDGWMQVSTYDGSLGWIPADAAQKLLPLVGE